MLKGKLYGIGVGPGDPELLTFKAVATIRTCDVIAVPDPDGAEKTAFSVVREYLDEKPVLECSFSMQRDRRQRNEQRAAVAERIVSVLESGKSVGFITLGDPSVYSTFGYVRKIVVSRGFESETIPGITSFSAAAAALNLSLCEGNESLHVVSAGEGEDVERWLDLPGTKIVMKSGRNFSAVLEILRRKGLSERTSAVSRCTMEDQRIYGTIGQLDRSDEATGPGYFSVFIVKEEAEP